MWQMIVDTSSQRLYIAFVFDGEVKYCIDEMGKNNHSDYLMQDIEDGIEKLNINIKDFDEFIVGIGPGRYTGLRIGLTVLKMFSWTLKKPLFTLSSLDILSSAYYKTDGNYKVMLRAKRGYSYTKVVSIKSGVRKVIEEEKFSSDEEFLEKYPTELLIDNSNAKIDIVRILSLKAEVTDIRGIEPNYLRTEQDVL